jgi:hypothetical protein
VANGPPRCSVTTPSRIGPQIAATLAFHRTPTALVDDELGRMRECRFAPTANRSVVGVLYEFVFLADVYRRNDPDLDLLHLARRLASTPCGPLYRRHVSPDREPEAFLRASSPPGG